MKFDHKLIIRLWLLEPLQWTHRVSYIQLLYSLHRTRQRSVRRGKIKAFPYIPTTSICIFITLAIAPKYLYLLKFVWREHSNTPDNTPRGILVGMFSVTSNINSNLTKSLILLIHNVWRYYEYNRSFVKHSERVQFQSTGWGSEAQTWKLFNFPVSANVTDLTRNINMEVPMLRTSTSFQTCYFMARDRQTDRQNRDFVWHRKIHDVKNK